MIYEPNLTKSQISSLLYAAQILNISQTVPDGLIISSEVTDISISDIVEPQYVYRIPSLFRSGVIGANLNLTFQNKFEKAILSRGFKKISGIQLPDDDPNFDWLTLIYGNQKYSFVASSEQFGLYIKMLLSE